MTMAPPRQPQRSMIQTKIGREHVKHRAICDTRTFRNPGMLVCSSCFPSSTRSSSIRISGGITSSLIGARTVSQSTDNREPVQWHERIVSLLNQPRKEEGGRNEQPMSLGSTLNEIR